MLWIFSHVINSPTAMSFIPTYLFNTDEHFFSVFCFYKLCDNCILCTLVLSFVGQILEVEFLGYKLSSLYHWCMKRVFAASREKVDGSLWTDLEEYLIYNVKFFKKAIAWFCHHIRKLSLKNKFTPTKDRRHGYIKQVTDCQISCLNTVVVMISTEHLTG